MALKKMVISGDWRHYIYEEAFASVLQEFGFQVVSFKISSFFSSTWGKVQQRFPIPGPTLFKLNNALLLLVKNESPDFFLAWRNIHLLPTTIKKINTLGVKTISYNNDDPFGTFPQVITRWKNFFYWILYKKGLKYFDYNYFYRDVNVLESIKYGATNSKVMMPYFIPWKDKPIHLNRQDRKKYECDFVFIGHYEPDNRVECLRVLVHAGFSVKLFGDSTWTPKILGDLYKVFAPIVPARGKEYAKAICGANVCLVFLSKLNRDTYTRRCFEIPACGKPMLAERTEDLKALFHENREACFFSNKRELVYKAEWLVKKPNIAKKIGEAGQRRVWLDKHDIKNRVIKFSTEITKK